MHPDEIFQRRLDRVRDELKWLYMEIFHDEHAFDYFCTMLKKCYDERDDSLKEWDARRLKDRNWFRSNKMLGYVCYTSAFGKTLKGVMDHIDYLKESHVTYLHIMPPLETPEGKSDGGYAVSDFRKIKESLGTMDDLRELSRRCHAEGISLCLDFVMNHTSEEHEWAKKAKTGDPQYMSYYFFYDDRLVPDEYDKTVPQVFPTTAPGNFTWCPEVQKYVLTTFYPYQWDLNYRIPTVFNDMTENMLFLCNHGIDVIRLDAVPYIWKELGTNCRNLPQVHSLVRMMRLASEVVCPGTLLLGEVVMEPDKVVPYFGSVEKPVCHMLYNVTTMATTWHTVATKDVRLLKKQLETVFSLPREYTFLNYLRCHDDIGWGLDYGFLRQFGMEEVLHKKFLNDYFTGKLPYSNSMGELYNDDETLGDARLCGTTASLCGIERALLNHEAFALDDAVRLDLMLHAFLFTQSGLPMLYSGDEIAALNDETYHDDPHKADDSRYLHRGDFDWDAASSRNDPMTVQGRIYTGIQKLCEIRRAHPFFYSHTDTWTIETWNDHVLAIGRYFDDEKLIAFFNFSNGREICYPNEGERYVDLWTGEEVDHLREVEIDAYDFKWYFHSYKES